MDITLDVRMIEKLRFQKGFSSQEAFARAISMTRPNYVRMVNDVTSTGMYRQDARLSTVARIATALGLHKDEVGKILSFKQAPATHAGTRRRSVRRREYAASKERP